MAVPEFKSVTHTHTVSDGVKLKAKTVPKQKKLVAMRQTHRKSQIQTHRLTEPSA